MGFNSGLKGLKLLISLISHMHNNNGFHWESWLGFHYWWN